MQPHILGVLRCARVSPPRASVPSMHRSAGFGRLAWAGLTRGKELGRLRDNGRHERALDSLTCGNSGSAHR